MRYANQEHTAVLASDGRLIPAAPGNRDWDDLVASGATIADYVAPPSGADDVRAEASRRMQLLVGARDAKHLEIIIANGTREAVRLLRLKDERPWTDGEVQRAAGLAGVDLALEAIRAASNVLEPEPPADFRDDRHWPKP